MNPVGIVSAFFILLVMDILCGRCLANPRDVILSGKIFFCLQEIIQDHSPFRQLPKNASSLGDFEDSCLPDSIGRGFFRLIF